jgi:hypothetical protein
LLLKSNLAFNFNLRRYTEREAGRTLNRIAGKYLKYQRMEETARVAKKMTGSSCRTSFGRNQNNGCIIYNGKEKCTW